MLGVDVFFWLSGFLATISILNQFQKLMDGKKFKISIILFTYLHRFLRIWPTYIFAIGIFWLYSPFWGSGPLWFVYQL